MLVVEYLLCMNNKAVYFPTFISRGNSQQITILTRLLIKGLINCWKVLEKFFNYTENILSGSKLRHHG